MAYSRTVRELLEAALGLKKTPIVSPIWEGSPAMAGRPSIGAPLPLPGMTFSRLPSGRGGGPYFALTGQIEECALAAAAAQHERTESEHERQRVLSQALRAAAEDVERERSVSKAEVERVAVERQRLKEERAAMEVTQQQLEAQVAALAADKAATIQAQAQVQAASHAAQHQQQEFLTQQSQYYFQQQQAHYDAVQQHQATLVAVQQPLIQFATRAGAVKTPVGWMPQLIAAGGTSFFSKSHPKIPK